jgi:hypothetical protein
MTRISTSALGEFRSVEIQASEGEVGPMYLGGVLPTPTTTAGVLPNATAAAQ